MLLGLESSQPTVTQDVHIGTSHVTSNYRTYMKTRVIHLIRSECMHLNGGLQFFADFSTDHRCLHISQCPETIYYDCFMDLPQVWWYSATVEADTQFFFYTYVPIYACTFWMKF